ncbi:hypothetical protein [Nannocystis pusilla]|uniref:SCP2 domain-containing protein n=1 Tax=Nannocystis pusilla TaxID=889268 RepID=A0ABS7TS34_9BACT|nr:hypothetical protein [Nannocystis pusilla]MBZ5710995.1 hypothetical protein [Nannocystis pusilla]
MLAELLDEALAVLARESPTHARLLRERLDGCRIAFTVDGERMTTRGGARVPAADTTVDHPDLHIDTDARTVLALLDDRLTLLDAIRTGVLKARGPRGALARAEAAMQVFIHGLVRCRSAPDLLRKFRSSVPHIDEITHD